MTRITLKPAALLLAIGAMGLTACDGVAVGVSGGYGYYHDPFYSGMIWHDYNHDHDVDIDIDNDVDIDIDRPGHHPNHPNHPGHPNHPKPPVAKPLPGVAKPPAARPPIHRPAPRPSPRRR